MQSKQLPDIDHFSTLSVVDSGGREHVIAGFWKEQRAALVFVRQIK